MMMGGRQAPAARRRKLSHLTLLAGYVFPALRPTIRILVSVSDLTRRVDQPCLKIPWYGGPCSMPPIPVKCFPEKEIGVPTHQARDPGSSKFRCEPPNEF